MLCEKIKFVVIRALNRYLFYFLFFFVGTNDSKNFKYKRKNPLLYRRREIHATEADTDFLNW